MVVFPEAERPVNQRVKPVDLGVWMPHSILSEPAQRPARPSSSRLTGRVHGMQPIEA